MKNPQLISDRLWQIAEQLLDVEDQNTVADAIEKLSALSQEFQPREWRSGMVEPAPVPAGPRARSADLMLN